MIELPTENDPRLEATYRSDRVWSGVTTSGDGRVFVSFPNADRPGIQVAELGPDGQHVPYPNAAWNAVRDDHDPEGAFVQVNGLRIGPDGRLWIIDAGAPGIGRPAIDGGARLIVVNLSTDTVSDVYDLSPATRPRSYLDDLRFNGDRIYLTDAGEPGLIVLDLGTGQLRRLLDDHPSTTDQRPLYADHRKARGAEGDEVLVHADQLEVSPDGRQLYYQPASGPMSRIGTRWLDDPSVTPGELADQVEDWLDTPTTGGTAIDANGVIYLSDTNQRRLLAISPDREVETVVADPRLVWADAMWLDHAGDLWIPVPQLNRTAGFNGGVQAVEYPVWIYKMHVGAGPAPNDHQ
ncbi:major royal jelly family protein [Micromonospora sp. NBC_01699]|uniref:SMP-30/gluconolactonase/LRE family protein n=1 Tax=Micromonospora sp. NBC_01699 TaxID=2975984 RepID=UPI002E27FE32|nr:L-dopachrome tautomerase-related protein [Micromonospora sp. NBC_01699]